MSVTTALPPTSRAHSTRPVTETPAAAGPQTATAAPAAAPAARDSFRSSGTSNSFTPRPAVDLPDPAFMTRNTRSVDAGKEGVRRVEGELFVNGPSLEDAKQGWAGDCYLIAAMGAIAASDPGKIRDIMRPNPDGTVTVRLHEKDKEGKLVPREVTVDADFLVRDPAGAGKEMVYASSAEAAKSGKPELWVPLLEKAYAQLKGGFDNIGMGGDPAAALEALTGQKSQSNTIGTRPDRMEVALGQRLAQLFKVDPATLTGPMIEAREKNAAKAWEVLQQAVQSQEPAVVCTYHEPELLQSGLMPMHAYTLVGVEEKDGQRLVTLRNPAPYIKELEGNAEVRAEMLQNEDFKMLADLLAGSGASLSNLHYGTFTIPFEEFQRGFSNISRTPVAAKG